MYHLQTRQVPVCRFSLQRVCACISEDRRDGRWESEREGRWDKAGCLLLPATCLVQQADFVLWLKVKSFWTSTTPMNYTSLSLPPDAPPPHSLCISPSLLIFLPLSPQDSDCLCECFFSVFSHVPVSEQFSPHGLCCGGMRYICLHFCSYTLFLFHLATSYHPVLCSFALRFFLTTAAHILEIESL